MNKTKIDWCDSTWNPVTGCLHGCEYCYARGIANRFSSHGDKWDDRKIHVLDEKVYAPEEERSEPYPYGFVPTLHRYRLNEYQNRKARQGTFLSAQWLICSGIGCQILGFMKCLRHVEKLRSTTIYSLRRIQSGMRNYLTAICRLICGLVGRRQGLWEQIFLSQHTTLFRLL